MPNPNGKPIPGAMMTISRIAALCLLALPIFYSTSCETPVEPGDCVGGVVIDGVCEGRCTPDKCLDQNTCVNNRCMLLCTSHLECYPDGEQSCLPATEDETGADITVCQPSGKATGTGASCLAGTECDRFLTCPDGGGCLSDQCDGDPSACVTDEETCQGKEGCTAGKCKETGEACRVSCADDCSEWLACQAIGEGDAASYCTTRDCQSDDDCLAGYYCGIIREPNDICGPSCEGPAGAQTCSGGPRDGAACTSDSFCQKGNDELCGQTTEPCKTPGQGDGTLFEGSACLLGRACLKREQGAPCATDLDCSRTEDQKCASLGGDTRCAHACTSDFDCTPDAQCDAAQGACLPRFGAWVGTGKFCEPCVSDEDCGSNGDTSACALILGGERACFDSAYSVQCTADADCPVSPSGKQGTCLDEGEGYSPTSPLYQRCYLPIDPSTMKTSCW